MKLLPQVWFITFVALDTALTFSVKVISCVSRQSAQLSSASAADGRRDAIRRSLGTVNKRRLRSAAVYHTIIKSKINIVNRRIIIKEQSFAACEDSWFGALTAVQLSSTTLKHAWSNSFSFMWCWLMDKSAWPTSYPVRHSSGPRLTTGLWHVMSYRPDSTQRGSSFSFVLYLRIFKQCCLKLWLNCSNLKMLIISFHVPHQFPPPWGFGTRGPMRKDHFKRIFDELRLNA